MLQPLEIKAFFFNAKTDYLPYYKNFSLTIETEDANATIKELLNQIKALNENFSFPEHNLILKINNLVVESTQSLRSLVKSLGSVWQIDPVNSYRSINGLIINDGDFRQSFSLLAPYATEDDERYFESLYALHYASQTEKFDHDYIGDAVLVLAHKMIQEGSEHKEAILEAITSADSGLFDCEYENTLFNAQEHSKTIVSLKEMVRQDEAPSLCQKLLLRLKSKTKAEPKQRIAQTIDELESKQIAYYYAQAPQTATRQHIKQSGLMEVRFGSAHRLCGLGILKDNKALAFKKAGAILLDAFDAGAEVLIVEEEAAFEMFQKHFRAIEKTVGREMIGLELLLAQDFIAQTQKAIA